MSHFYGVIQGNRGEATRGGSKASGFSATAASWQGSVRVHLYEDAGTDFARITLEPWQGQGASRFLYDGPISGPNIWPWSTAYIDEQTKIDRRAP